MLQPCLPIEPLIPKDLQLLYDLLDYAEGPFQERIRQGVVNYHHPCEDTCGMCFGAWFVYEAWEGGSSYYQLTTTFRKGLPHKHFYHYDIIFGDFADINTRIAVLKVAIAEKEKEYGIEAYSRVAA